MAGLPEKGFNWHELMTTDTEGARQFYEAVTGLKATSGEYPMFMSGEHPVGGLTGPRDGKAEWPSGSGAHWISYIGVPDADAAAAKAEEMGGEVFLGPVSIPGWGRVAGIRDPQGAAFGVFQTGEVKASD